eukprot:sb/3473021/
MYVYFDPVNKDCAEGTPDNVDWDFAQKEIAQAKGFGGGGDGQLSKGIYLLSLWITLSLHCNSFHFCLSRTPTWALLLTKIQLILSQIPIFQHNNNMISPLPANTLSGMAESFHQFMAAFLANMSYFPHYNAVQISLKFPFQAHLTSQLPLNCLSGLA